MKFYLVTDGELSEILQAAVLHGTRLIGTAAALAVKPTAVMSTVETLQKALTKALVFRDDQVALAPVLTRLKRA